ncbi:MAG: DUF167 domain-containing protein [Parvibaculum sp.]|uniref:DUF167 family protein n=1 Tax=Parvibaculum sp. TaxID=2024848 RepID=UPI001DC89483|nr:DUF167 family protein [Parvibaculum sp.]MBX3489636.1 DUF167 domain-containing protein [Parvibaculum sp.]MBX3491886.1 DUF167 domain-containing protein [Parvibaculum sp.]MBX3494688.1 DUF167 domain-containing protein [Parvibaculum sp.]MCW5726406.1 DUF167 domain-containing protein [Parvibaculum sp.]
MKALAGGVAVRLRVTPRGGADRIEGLACDPDGNGFIRLRVSAVAEKGRANEAVLKLLAKAWRLPRTSLSVTAGETGRNKVVTVAGDAAALEARISAWLDGLPGETGKNGAA